MDLKEGPINSFAKLYELLDLQDHVFNSKKEMFYWDLNRPAKAFKAAAHEYDMLQDERYFLSELILEEPENTISETRTTMINNPTGLGSSCVRKETGRRLCHV